MFDFFRSHFSDLCYLVSFVILSVNNVVQLVKRLRSEKMYEILLQVPEFISQIESLFPSGGGAVKLGYVLNEIRKRCESSRIKFDKSYWTDEVEKVLTSPTASHYKKGGIYEEKSNEESQR